MTKFNVGDVVRILPDFEKHRYYDDPTVNSEMSQYAGRQCTISRILNRNEPNVWYHMREIEWTWDERWLKKEELDMTDVSESDIMEMFTNEN